MNFTHASSHPYHDRRSCEEDNPGYNAEATGSNGCARCTALLMDREARQRKALEWIVRNRFAHSANILAVAQEGLSTEEDDDN